MLISFSWLFGCRGGRPEHPPAEARLERLGIFYGWPSTFNGATGAEQAAEGLGLYDVVVLGDGLQDPGHGDHAKTRAIIAALTTKDRKVYGYIPLGKASALDLSAIEARARAWGGMGVSGVFFDEAGHDFGNTRQRQNAAIEAAHALKLKVFANAFDPDDLFSRAPTPQNPGGLATALGPGDSYLYESFGLIRGEPEQERFRLRKLRKLRVARRLGLTLHGVTTPGASGAFQARAWQRVLDLARASKLHGLGWGEPHFAAQDGRMPPRPWPGE